MSGANVSEVNNQGFTPLHYAALNGNVLDNSKASKSIKNKKKKQINVFLQVIRKS